MTDERWKWRNCPSDICRAQRRCCDEPCRVSTPPEHTGTAQEIDLADGVPMFVRFNGKEFVMIDKEAFEKMRNESQ
ncbi:MAG: hypothetical protein KC496_22900 [Anaerolineae bacterium]|nr:hypothetical protein [Anaerolineae bacterium]